VLYNVPIKKGAYMIWKPVVGAEGFYEVSDTGLVRGVDRLVDRGKSKMLIRGRVLRQDTDSRGRKRVGMRFGGKRVMRRVHSIVLESFLRSRKMGEEVRHLDGNPSNNMLKNLCYGTHSENMQDMVRHGNSIRNRSGWNTKLRPENIPEIRKIGRDEIDKKKDAAKRYGVRIETIKSVINKKSWSWV